MNLFMVCLEYPYMTINLVAQKCSFQAHNKPNLISVTDSIKRLAAKRGLCAMIKFPVRSCQTPRAIYQIRKLQAHIFFSAIFPIL